MKDKNKIRQIIVAQDDIEIKRMWEEYFNFYWGDGNWYYKKEEPNIIELARYIYNTNDGLGNQDIKDYLEEEKGE